MPLLGSTRPLARILSGLSVLIFASIIGCDKSTSGDISLKNRVRFTQERMETYARAIKDLAADCGSERLNSTNVLPALGSNPGWQGWNGPYLLNPIVPLDRGIGDFWGSGMALQLTNGTLRITSAGPDRKMGTSDDIIFSVTVP
jgi:hypothetical protein